MAIKKSERYNSLWKSCDELRGSMDASQQYKDYVGVLLFMKYVSDKGERLVDIPEGGSFKDMAKLKGKTNIGEKINMIIDELAKANDLTGIITVADFDDDEKLYTPAEVSRILAQVIGIECSKSQSETICDPTFGSGSLLLKKPVSCQEYILVHKMAHLLERHHNDRFKALMDHYLPNWKHRQEELNRLPVRHVGVLRGGLDGGVQRSVSEVQNHFIKAWFLGKI